MTALQIEHAALVALLRTRPNKLTWRKLTDRVLADGSAVDVWHTVHPETEIVHRADMTQFGRTGGVSRTSRRQVQRTPFRLVAYRTVNLIAIGQFCQAAVE